MLDKMRYRKGELEQKIESLAAQNRLLKASKVESGISMDGTQLSKAEQLLGQIETRLAVAQRVLEHEQDAFAIPLNLEKVDEANVIAAYDEHFADPADSDKLVRFKTPGN